MTQDMSDAARIQTRLDALRSAVALKRLRASGGADAAQDQAVKIPRIDRSGPLPLSWAQHRLWFLDRLDSAAGAAYRIGAALRLRGPLQSSALAEALADVVTRHEVLRTRFVNRAGEPELCIAPDAEAFCLSFTDLSALDVETRDDRLDRLCGEEARLPFDLAVDLPMRARLVRLSVEEHVLLLVQHHIVSDGWSIGVLIREVAQGYVARVMPSDAVPPAPLPLQYVDYAAWQRDRLQGPEFEQQIVAWRLALTAAPVLSTLPADRTRPVRPQHRGARIPIVYSAREAAALRRLAAGLGTTPFAVLFAAWGVLLARAGGQRDLVIGTPVANRPHSELEKLIGLFVETLPVRMRLPSSTSVAMLVRSVHDALHECYERQDVPLDRIVDAVRPERALNHGPLFQTLVSFNNTPAMAAMDGGLRIEDMPFDQGTASHDLVLGLAESGEGLAGTLTYDVDLFDRRTAERWAEAFHRLVCAMSEDPQAEVDALPLLSVAERDRLLETFNATCTAYAGPQTVHGMFEAQVAQRPDAVAVSCGDEALSYAALNARANRLAHALIAHGVRPDDRVGLCAERSLAMAVGLLGILKAGAAYVPLDPSYPAERLRAMVEDSAPQVVLTHAPAQAVATTLAVEAWSLDALDAWAPTTATDPDPVTLGLTPSHLAYVIYTSGSTGTPKGAMNQHDGVCNRLRWAQQVFALTAEDRLLQKTPYGFDVSVWEFFLAWASGARLDMVRPGGHQDPEYLGGRVVERGTTVLHFVPSMLDAFLRHARPGALSGVRAVLCSGEALGEGLRDRFLAQYPMVALYNLYGPTEAAVDVTWWRCAPGEGTVPIGCPAPNVRMYVLDERMSPVPVGAVGELYIGGVQVGRGYLNREALSAERFVVDPFVDGGRLYRTGDLGRWREDGALEYLGRNDFQVKLRGYRIEPGEIEAVLRTCTGVREAVVVAHRTGSGDPQLVAHVEAEAGTGVDAEALREALSSQLPGYMVPAAYVWIEAWPLSANGKLDRSRLPPPDAASYAHRTYAAPEGDAERTLATVWSDVLGVTRVGRHDDFFELGGDSIRSIAVVAQARDRGQSFSIADLFRTPTIAALAASAAHTPVPGPSTAPRGPRPVADRDLARLPGGIEDAYAATLLQQGMIFHAHRDAASGAYHDVFSYELALPGWCETTLRGVLEALTERHQALRTGFVHAEVSEPLQLVHAQSRIPLAVIDLRNAGGDAQAEAIKAFLAAERVAPFDLAQPPLCRVFVHRLDASRIRYTLSFHHAILDGWSVALMQTELFDRYLRCLAGEVPAPMPALAASPADAVAAEQAALDDPAQAAYWRVVLDGISPASLPPLEGAAIATGSYHAQIRALPEALEAALRAAAQAMRVPVRTLLLTAHLRVLAAYCGSADVVTGLVSNVRPERHDGDRVLGLFLNTLPLRVQLGAGAWSELVTCVHGAELALLERRAYPYFRLHRDHGAGPLFESIFNYVDFHTYDALNDDGIRLLGATTHEWTGYPLDVSFSHTGGRLVLQVNVDPERLSGVQAGRIADALVGTLAALADNPNAVHDLHAVGAPAEATETSCCEAPPALCAGDAPLFATVHEGVVAAARTRGEAIAVVDGECSLSYYALDAEADALAARLRAVGVRPGTRVALCLPRGTAVIVGMLGILKAGGAYVPIDTALPDMRIVDMLADSAPIAILTDRATSVRLRTLRDATTPLLCVDEPSDVPQADVTSESTANADDAAYVIYTSGSTGRPKGVVVEHRNVVHLIRNHLQRCELNRGDRVMQYANFGFDTSVEEIFPTLWAGATLVLRPASLVAPDAAFHRFLHDAQITVADLPTAFWHRWVQVLVHPQGDASDIRRWPALRLVVVGGEKAEPALLATWRGLLAMRDTVWLNTYGPTEATVYATAQAVRCADAPCDEDGSIGRPIPGSRVRVVDPFGQPAPVGAVGELWIGGDGVARGYLGRPELTAERFVVANGERWYRSGDLARWCAGGYLAYLGRNDAQLKLRGYRIEPGEIEAALLACAALREAVVMVRRDAEEPRLVAYVVPMEAADTASTDPHVLRAALVGRLPDYMLPSAFVALPALPMTASGKIDRASLPVPDGSGVQSAYVAPLPGVETILAQIWADLLGLTRVGREDHFFELGGHSLMIVGMIEQLRSQSISLDVQSVFEAPRLDALARRTLQADTTGKLLPENPLDARPTRIEPELLPLADLDQVDIDAIVAAVPGGGENIQDVYPLGTLQTGILFHHLIHPEGDPYLLRYVARVDREDRLQRLLESLQQVIDRHDALRTAVHWESLLTPVQVVQRHAPMIVKDLALDEGEDAVAQMFRMTDPRVAKKDLRAAPLLEARRARDSQGGWLLAVLVHHMVSDHVTQSLILGEIDLLLRDRADQLQPPIPFRHFIAAQRQMHEDEQRHYFEARFGDLDVPTLVFGVPEVRGTGDTVAAVHEPVDVALARRIRGVAKQLGVTPALLFHVAWAHCLATLVGREDVVFGTVLSGRLQGVEGSGRAMGVFINTLPVRFQLAGLSLREAIDLAFRELSMILRHEQAPLALAQRCSRVPARTPLFNTLFNYRHSPIGSESTIAEARQTWSGIELILGEERTNYPVAVSVDDQGASHGFVVSVQCVAGIDPDAVRAMTVTAITGIVDALERDTAQPLASIAIVPETITIHEQDVASA
jgi:amino acid adenylation domain-containing protein